MEPRACRHKRRTEQARSLGLTLLCAAVLVTGSFAAMLPGSRAIGVTRQDASAGLRSLSSAESLAVSRPVAALGSVTAGVPLDGRGVLTVRNTARRTLTLNVSVSGAQGLTAEVQPGVLAPGQSAEVILAGTAVEPGPLRGSIIITALDGFVRRSVTLTGEVLAPRLPGILVPTPGVPLPVQGLPMPMPADPMPAPVIRVPEMTRPTPVGPGRPRLEPLPVPHPAGPAAENDQLREAFQ